MSELFGKLLGYFVVFLGVFAAVFATTSFVMWDFNVANWTSEARFAVALVTSVATALILAPSDEK